jgi:hypothetical protein
MLFNISSLCTLRISNYLKTALIVPIVIMIKSQSGVFEMALGMLLMTADGGSRPDTIGLSIEEKTFKLERIEESVNQRMPTHQDGHPLPSY